MRDNWSRGGHEGTNEVDLCSDIVGTQDGEQECRKTEEKMV